MAIWASQLQFSCAIYTECMLNMLKDEIDCEVWEKLDALKQRLGPYDMQLELTGTIEVFREAWGDSTPIEGGKPPICVKGCMAPPPMFPAVWFLIPAFRPDIFDTAL
ncbi:hypothetical protein CJ030_MR3G009888 [Morella rubra]|uniref:Uncharacterized protein n=1 Tax=Morella rubra TaxID=262757 RepID=A0A6A1W9P9_9ROSI|nr:hypothetical protein CJ030_MR3G009888 [Morella rubra]